MSAPQCIVTVTSNDFAVGTVVMLDSFRRTNPWFHGDALVLADRLSAEATAVIATVRGVRILPIGADLLAALDRLRAARPDLESRIARFFSLEAFRLQGYDRILFCDSDLLFLETIEPLLSSTAPVVGVADNAARRGRARDRHTFLDVDRDSAAPDALYPTFNAGMLLIRGGLAVEWPAFLAELEPERWQEARTGHSDQIVLNRLLSSRTQLVDDSYNCILSRPDLLKVDEIAIARVLHFNGPAKPWLRSARQVAGRDPVMFDAMARWIAAYGSWQSNAAARG